MMRVDLRRWWMRWRLVLVLVLLNAGCTPFATLQGPKTLAPGQHQLKAAISLPDPGFLRHVDDEDLENPFAFLTLGMRHGLLPRLDLGWQLSGLNGVTVDLKGEILPGPVSASLDAAMVFAYDIWSEKVEMEFVPALLVGNERFYVGLKRLSFPEESWAYRGNPVAMQLGMTIDRRRVQLVPEVSAVFASEGAFVILSFGVARLIGRAP